MPLATVLVPTGHLGFTPFEAGSFEAGVARGPDFLVADSGSSDIGPYPLGSDAPVSPERWQEQDLERMLLASRRLGIPMVVGSACDTGSNRGVDRYVGILRRVAARHRLAPFRLACIYAEVPLEELYRRLDSGTAIEGLSGRPALTRAVLDRTDRVVAVMGAEPLLEALRQGADVVIAGRCSDSALIAAPLLLRGASRAQAFLAGKLMECASFCAEPFMGKESVLGLAEEEGGVVVEPMHPDQRCTPRSVASHAMYERADPFAEVVPGGRVDLRGCRYEAVDHRRTRVSGARFVEEPYRVKLEGSGLVGQRAWTLAGIRDPLTIGNLEGLLAWSRRKVEERFGPPGRPGTDAYQLHFHVYGRDGVLGPWETQGQASGHEVGILTEVVAGSWELAEEIAALATRNLFYARLPVVKGTAGLAAFPSDEVLRGRPAYEWTVNHVMAVEDPLELFPTHFITIDGAATAAGAGGAGGDPGGGWGPHRAGPTSPPTRLPDPHSPPAPPGKGAGQDEVPAAG